MSELQFVVDIEPTNRCNAKCHFCPRDATPHQGLMTSEIFDRALGHAAEFEGARVQVNLCGLGEPLLNKLSPDFVKRIRDRGYGCSLSTNAALLDERRGHALIDAGLQKVFINVSDVGEEYEKVYQLPFERTRDNIVRFAADGGDDVEVIMVLVDHRRSREHLDAMRTYWRDQGLDRFMEFDIMNRGGALFVDHMQYSQYPERAEAETLLEMRERGTALCSVPFMSVFVGYDGNFYLCCSDWRKEAPVGNVFDSSPFSVMEPKLAHVMSGNPVCKTCNLDPLNRVTDALRDVHGGDKTQAELDALVASMLHGSSQLANGLDKQFPGVVERVRQAVSAEQRGRRLIPVTTVS